MEKKVKLNVKLNGKKIKYCSIYIRKRKSLKNLIKFSKKKKFKIFKINLFFQ